jgi:hypothetical protein
MQNKDCEIKIYMSEKAEGEVGQGYGVIVNGKRND